jgi:hypothetical protein
MIKAWIRRVVIGLIVILVIIQLMPGTVRALGSWPRGHVLTATAMKRSDLGTPILPLSHG